MLLLATAAQILMPAAAMTIGQQNSYFLSQIPCSQHMETVIVEIIAGCYSWQELKYHDKISICMVLGSPSKFCIGGNVEQPRWGESEMYVFAVTNIL